MTSEATVEFGQSQMRRDRTAMGTRGRPRNRVQPAQNGSLLGLGKVIPETTGAVARKGGEEPVGVGEHSCPGSARLGNHVHLPQFIE